MIKDFMDLSMEDKIKIISLGLGVLGFLISLTNVIILMYSRKVKLNFGIEQLRISPYYNNSNLASVLFVIENCSQLPVSITRMRIKINKTYYDAYRELVLIYEQKTLSGGVIKDSIKTYSNVLPINLSSLASFAGYLSFPIPQNILEESDTTLCFEIRTNRGKIYRDKLMQIPLHQYNVLF